MAIERKIALLVPRSEIAARVRQLKKQSLDKTRYPDKFIYRWQFENFLGDESYVEDVLSTFQSGEDVSGLSAKDGNGVERKGLEFLLGENPELYLPSRGYQYLYINIDVWQENYGNPDEDVTITISFPFSASVTNNHYPSRFLLEKVLEILQPKYGWSTSSDQIVWDREHQTREAKPWGYYSNTMIFGSRFQNDPVFIEWLEYAKDDLYYCRQLKGPVTYLADTSGFGNEDPSWFEIELQSDDKNTWIDYEDGALAELLREAQQNHKKKVEDLLNLGLLHEAS